MYFFNSVDRSNLGNAKTDGIDVDLHFKGNQYSLLLLLFYIPNGLCDLPLNMLTKRFSGRIMLPTLMLGWGTMALIQSAAKNFGGLLALRLILAVFEAGFFAGAVFYLSLFYARGELGFRIAIFFGSALLASAFSGLISYGVFQVKSSHVQGWQLLFIIEGSLTCISEKLAANLRMLRDGSSEVGTKLNLRDCFQTWKNWKFVLWCIISFTYSVAFTTTATFLPQIVARLGFSAVKTNLWTVAPNSVGFVVLLCITKSSDYFRERSLHIVLALCISLTGLIILTAIDVVDNKAVAYFACFLLCSGAYIPSCLVHSWHNNNNVNESSRAATTGLLVGLGNLSGILSTATFRTEYAPAYRPTLIVTAACNVTCIACTLWLGLWMKMENRRRDKDQGLQGGTRAVDTSENLHGENDPNWRFFS
ncbi:putative pantothenate transporter [Aureobasidium melanogenum CBS 110374]|uniref:Putative pantothenate transporter n=1 Tax=Aureobasidium melanogenum (strain CBS 110374) TaxID=1043003 RepID=A0A074W0R9_AURM1|nr:putative pantothenate transporter [Aureobasidium melanogenum CBS 110374]KEQ66408.1 putative pantothenate transporter [Aureobasidium melanogenum CBS 110374]